MDVGTELGREKSNTLTEWLGETSWMGWGDVGSCGVCVDGWMDGYRWLMAGG